MGCDYFLDKEQNFIEIIISDYDGNFRKTLKIPTDKFNEKEDWDEVRGIENIGRMSLEIVGAKGR